MKQTTKEFILVFIIIIIILLCSPAWAMASSFTRFRDHTQRHATFGRTSLEELSARRTELNGMFCKKNYYLFLIKQTFSKCLC
jgi:hypothetical protein